MGIESLLSTLAAEVEDISFSILGIDFLSWGMLCGSRGFFTGCKHTRVINMFEHPYGYLASARTLLIMVHSKCLINTNNVTHGHHFSKMKVQANRNTLSFEHFILSTDFNDSPMRALESPHFCFCCRAETVEVGDHRTVAAEKSCGFERKDQVLNIHLTTSALRSRLLRTQNNV